MEKLELDWRTRLGDEQSFAFNWKKRRERARALSRQGDAIFVFFVFALFYPDNLIVLVSEFAGPLRRALRSRHDRGKIFNGDHGRTSLSGENSDPISRGGRDDAQDRSTLVFIRATVRRGPRDSILPKRISRRRLLHNPFRGDRKVDRNHRPAESLVDLRDLRPSCRVARGGTLRFH